MKMLVTTRPPVAGYPRDITIVPVGRDWGHSAQLASRWLRAGNAVAPAPASIDSPNLGAKVREAFDVCADGKSLPTVIRRQREALLAPEWISLAEWLSTALMGASKVFADVPAGILGCVEMCTPAGVEITIRPHLRREAWRRGLVSFITGELLAKGLAAGSSRNQSPRTVHPGTVLVYAEWPSHLRALRPVIAHLIRHNVHVVFGSSAVVGTVPRVTTEAERYDSLSMDRLAVIDGSWRAVTTKALRYRSLPDVRGPIGPAALHALALRARYGNWVYEKFRVIAEQLNPGCVLFGEASSHRAGALCDAFRQRHIPTVTLQHGHITDAHRYLQESDAFLVWDHRSAGIVRAAGYDGSILVVGNPGLEAEVTRLPKDVASGREAAGVLVAPTGTTMHSLAAWLRQAARLSGPDAIQHSRVRLHPSMRNREGAAIVEAAGFQMSHVISEAEDILRADSVITGSPSLACEARVLGVPCRYLGLNDSGLEAVEAAALDAERSVLDPPLAGSVTRASEAVSRLVGTARSVLSLERRQ